MNKWNQFWTWYDKQITKNLLVMAIIIFMQVPHMVWAGDVLLETGMISRVHPVLDFFLYGIDLIEVITMIQVGTMIYARIRNRGNNT